MSNIIKVDFGNNKVIDHNKLSSLDRSLPSGLISSANKKTTHKVVEDHTSEPIKDIEDIQRISDYLINEGKYRDNMLFILGINFGLRISDLITLTFSHLIDEDFTFKTTFPLLEQKTSTTRKVKKNRYITINDAVVEAVTLYLQHTPNVRLSDYLFTSNSNRNKYARTHITRCTADNIVKSMCKAVGITSKVSTHTLRKTFAYHHMLQSNNDPRTLLLLQKMFGHSSATQTLQYIGITNDEIEEAYLNLNLGSSANNLRLTNNKAI